MERRLLQSAVLVAAVVPILGGVLGAFGPPVTASGNVFTDSHYRYLSGLLLGIGVGFLTTVPHIEKRGERFRLLAAVVVCGGSARLIGSLIAHQLTGTILFTLVMELGVTPALAWWQGRVAAASKPPDA